ARAAPELGVVEHHVREMERGLLLEDAALHALTSRLRMTLHEVHLLHHHAHLLLIDREHAPGLALVVPGDHLNDVALANLDRHLDHLRSERDDLHERLLAKLARHGPEDAGPARFLVVVDEHHRVLVEADVEAVLASPFLDRAHHDRLRHVTFLHARAWDRVLDLDHDDVTEPAVTAMVATQHLDALGTLGAGVVRHRHHGSELDHLARSTNSTKRQRLSFESGRVSMKRIVSPMRHSFFSSCTLNLARRRT